jgi:hypothetical protein
MKTGKNILSLAIVAGILSICAPTGAGMRLSTDEPDKPFLIGRPYLELTGIKEVHFDIAVYRVAAGKDNLTWDELKSSVKDKLIKAGIKMASSQTNSEQHIGCPQLRADVEVLRLEDASACVLRIQTSLARTVYLTKDSSWLIKADVWKTKPVMLPSSTGDMQSVVTDSVLYQVEAFINAYRIADSQPARSADANDIKAAARVLSETPSELLAIEARFVASKNSRIFHKPDCRWAKNISPKNLISYNSRDEAIGDGKKPCSTCKP